MRRTSRGAGCRTWRQNAPKSRVWHLESEAKNRKPEKSTPVAPCKCRSEHGAEKAPVPARMRPSSHFTCGGESQGRRKLAPWAVGDPVIFITFFKRKTSCERAAGICISPAWASDSFGLVVPLQTAPDMKRFFRNNFPPWNFLWGKLRNRA